MRCGLITRPHFYFGLAWSGEDCKKFDALLGPLVAKYIGAGQGCGMEDEIGDCREPAGSEQKKAEEASSGALLDTPSLRNEQPPNIYEGPTA